MNEVCHFLELLRCSKDCIAAAKKSKYTGSDFLAVMLEGRKEGGSFVPKIASGKFDLETAKRLRKYLCDHYCGFRLRARAVDGGEGGSGSARAFAISPRDVPQRVEFAHYDVSRVIELLHVYGEEKDMVRRFQVDRRPLDGRLFLELAGDGTLEQRLRDQGMSEDIVQHAKALQTALEKYGVSIERYAYSAVKFEANNIVADEDDLDSDDVVAAFDRVKRALSGLPYDKLEARVAGEMGDEELKKRIAPHGINEDDLRAILYLGSFDKVRDNYFLYNLNFNLEEGKDEFIREISDYICYVQRALNKLPTYQGTVYFVTTKTVEVNLTVDESIRFSPIVFATKSFDDIRAWVEDKPANYHIFKVHTKKARDTTVICSTFKNEVLLPIEYSYTVKKIKDNNIELEEEED